MMQVMQLIGVLFGFSMLYFTFVNYKRDEISLRGYAFWSAAWLAMTVLVLVPTFINDFIRSMGFTGLVQFLTVVGFLSVFALIFYMYKKINKLQKKLEHIVREMAKK